MKNGYLTTRLSGNVDIEHGDITLQSDEAVYYRQDGRIALEGSVQVTRCSTVVTADRMRYFEADKEVEAFGGVRIREGETRDNACDTLSYNLETERTVARGGVVIDDRANLLRTTGAYGEYTEGRSYGFITGEPVLSRTDSSGAVRFSVTCDTLRVYADSGYMVLDGRVRLARSGYTGTCDRASFHYDNERLELYGEPALGDTVHAVQGDSMTLFLDDFAMRRLTVRGHARHRAYRAGGADSARVLESELTGREMDVSFSADAIDTARISRNATSVYYRYRQDGSAEGVNEVTGNGIELVWDGRELVSARVTGGAAGCLRPAEGE